MGDSSGCLLLLEVHLFKKRPYLPDVVRFCEPQKLHLEDVTDFCNSLKGVHTEEQLMRDLGDSRIDTIYGSLDDIAEYAALLNY